MLDENMKASPASLYNSRKIKSLRSGEEYTVADVTTKVMKEIQVLELTLYQDSNLSIPGEISIGKLETKSKQ